MSQKTVDKKIKSYQSMMKNCTLPSGQYAAGYCAGVVFYRDFNSCSAQGKKITKDFFSDCSRDARSHGDMFSVGVMAGARDAANERKNKLRK